MALTVLENGVRREMTPQEEAKHLADLEAMNNAAAHKVVKAEQERMIQAKIRELAVTELKRTGDLPADYEDEVGF